MVTLLTDKGVPSVAKILPNRPTSGAGSAAGGDAGSDKGGDSGGNGGDAASEEEK